MEQEQCTAVDERFTVIPAIFEFSTKATIEK